MNTGLTLVSDAPQIELPTSNRGEIGARWMLVGCLFGLLFFF